MEKGEILRIKRVLLNLTQSEIAKEMFYTRQTITHIETGKTVNTRSFVDYRNALDRKINEHPEANRFKKIVEILEL